MAEVDVTKRWEGKTYHVHVTSGPSAMAKPAADSHVKEIKAIAAKHGAEPRVGVCYGDDAAISTVMKRTIEEEGGVPILSGQRFWEFVSGDAACAQTIFEICGRVGDAQASAAGKSTSASPEYQMERILEEFESQYGVKDFWAELFKKNS